jgi:hypothetical protein
MDYTTVLEQLRAASLFDLYRLRAALTLQLEEPARIEQVRARLRPSLRDRYGRGLALNQKTATILTSDQQRWRVAYQFLFPVIGFMDE